jgi:hypothetical protein
MGTTNGLLKRVERLEWHAPAGSSRDTVGEALMREVFRRAERIQGTTARPIEQQPPVERCIRGALAEAEGIQDGAARARVFWRGFVARGRAFLREHERCHGMAVSSRPCGTPGPSRCTDARLDGTRSESPTFW